MNMLRRGQVATWNSLKGYSRLNEQVLIINVSDEMVHIKTYSDENKIPGDFYYYWVHVSELSSAT